METGYKAFRREALEDLRIEEKRFGVEPEMTAKPARRQARIYQVGISYFGRTYAGGKKIDWRDGFHTLYVIFKYNLFRRETFVCRNRKKLQRFKLVERGSGPRYPKVRIHQIKCCGVVFFQCARIQKKCAGPAWLLSRAGRFVPSRQFG